MSLSVLSLWNEGLRKYDLGMRFREDILFAFTIFGWRVAKIRFADAILEGDPYRFYRFLVKSGEHTMWGCDFGRTSFSLLALWSEGLRKYDFGMRFWDVVLIVFIVLKGCENTIWRCNFRRTALSFLSFWSEGLRKCDWGIRFWKDALVLFDHFPSQGPTRT